MQVLTATPRTMYGPTVTTIVDRDFEPIARALRESHYREGQYEAPDTETLRREDRGTTGVEHVLLSTAPASNYNTNTVGHVSFVRMPHSSDAPERVVADDTLQARLENLCEALRSKY